MTRSTILKLIHMFAKWQRRLNSGDNRDGLRDFLTVEDAIYINNEMNSLYTAFKLSAE